MLALWSAATLASPVLASEPVPSGAPESDAARAAADEQAPADGERKDTLFVSGAFLTVLGGAAVVSSLLFTSMGPVEYCPNCASTQSEVLGTVLMIGGFASAVAGSALVVIGSSSAEGDEDESVTTPELALGPTSAALRWSF